MSTQESPVTDSNVVEEKQVNAEKTIVANDPVQNASTDGKNTKYEVVFFVRYHSCPRPCADDIKSYFSNYGTVDRVNCPDNRNYAFVFMTSLNTSAEHRRTRTTITQIINEMTPETRFHITVASSNRAGYSRPMQYSTPRTNYRSNYVPDRAQRYPNYRNRDYEGTPANNYDQPRRPYVRNSQNRTRSTGSYQFHDQNNANNGARQYNIHRQERQQ